MVGKARACAACRIGCLSAGVVVSYPVSRDDPQFIALEFMFSFGNLWNILAAAVSRVPKPPAQCTEENSHPVSCHLKIQLLNFAP